jgi:hypothetical protein
MPYYDKLLLYTQKSPEMNPPSFSVCSICQSVVVVVVGKKMMHAVSSFNPCFLCIIYMQVLLLLLKKIEYLKESRRKQINNKQIFFPPKGKGQGKKRATTNHEEFATHQSIIH